MEFRGGRQGRVATAFLQATPKFRALPASPSSYCCVCLLLHNKLTCKRLVEGFLAAQSSKLCPRSILWTTRRSHQQMMTQIPMLTPRCSRPAKWPS